MTFMFTRVQVDDYESWKPIFDGGRSTVRQSARGHRLFRTVQDPNEVLVAVEFDSRDDAEAARERLLASGMLERVTLKGEPTIFEEAEAVSY